MDKNKLSQEDIANYLNKDKLIELNSMDLAIAEKLSNLFGIFIEDLTKETITEKEILYTDFQDLDAISAVNKIVLNLKFMIQLLKRE